MSVDLGLVQKPQLVVVDGVHDPVGHHAFHAATGLGTRVIDTHQVHAFEPGLLQRAFGALEQRRRRVPMVRAQGDADRGG